MQNIRVTLKCIAWSGPRLLIFGLKTGGLKGQPEPTRNSYLARLDWHRANVLFAAFHPDNVIALSRRYSLQFNFVHFDPQNANYTDKCLTVSRIEEKDISFVLVYDSELF